MRAEDTMLFVRYLREGKYDEAIDILRRAINKEYPYATWVHRTYGRVPEIVVRTDTGAQARIRAGDNGIVVAVDTEVTVYAEEERARKVAKIMEREIEKQAKNRGVRATCTPMPRGSATRISCTIAAETADPIAAIRTADQADVWTSLALSRALRNAK